MAKLYNLARMTTATTGTGTITLGSAATSYLSFADAGVQNGETVTYAIVDGSNREIGRGVYTSSGTTLTRATILESTNSNNAINLSGSAEVFITAAAEDIANVGERNTFTSSQVISVTDNSNAALRITQTGSGNAFVVEDDTNPDSSPFAVKADGKVGIGTTTPNVQLEVNGSIRTSSTVPAVEIYESDAATNAKHWWFRADSGILALQAVDDAGGGGGALVQYTRSGNALQTMQGWRAGTVRYELSNWDSHLLFSNADAATGTATSNNFILRTNNTERFRVGTAGQWGIGGATYGTAGQAFVSGGASAAPSWSTLGIAGGGTGQTTASAAANSLDGYLEIVASAGTTTLDNTSARNIVVTGSTSHTIRMPDVTTLSLGWTFTITNLASSTVTLQSSGANNFVNPIGVSASVRLVCIAVTGTGTASWSLQFIGAANRSGSGNLVFSSNAALTTPTIAQISGGSAASSTLTLQSTSGAGTTDAIIFRTGSQSERFRIDTSGALGVGGTNYGTSGQVLTSNGSGAAPSWQTSTAGGATLLGTISTTSGTNPTLSGLTLTNYKQVLLVWQGVSHNSGTNIAVLVGTSTADDLEVTNNVSAATTLRGVTFIDLAEGTFYSILVNAGTSTSNTANLLYAGDMPITTASTSISIALSAAGSFDAGSIRVYGVS